MLAVMGMGSAILVALTPILGLLLLAFTQCLSLSLAEVAVLVLVLAVAVDWRIEIISP
jgi:hypothetical protein